MEILESKDSLNADGGTGEIVVYQQDKITRLEVLSKREAGVEAVIYTGKVSKQLQLDIDRHNAQYPLVEVHTFTKAHDRFLIIDDAAYLVGASIKDLGKKWFGFTLMENTDAEELLGRI